MKTVFLTEACLCMMRPTSVMSGRGWICRAAINLPLRSMCRPRILLRLAVVGCSAPLEFLARQARRVRKMERHQKIGAPIGAPKFFGASPFFAPAGLDSATACCTYSLSSTKKAKHCSPSKQRRDLAWAAARRCWLQRAAGRETVCWDAVALEVSTPPEEQPKECIRTLEQAIADVLKDDGSHFSCEFLGR